MRKTVRWARSAVAVASVCRANAALWSMAASSIAAVRSRPPRAAPVIAALKVSVRSCPPIIWTRLVAPPCQGLIAGRGQATIPVLRPAQPTPDRRPIAASKRRSATHRKGMLTRRLGLQRAPFLSGLCHQRTIDLADDLPALAMRATIQTELHGHLKARLPQNIGQIAGARLKASGLA